MRLLLTGAQGQLGSEVIRQVARSGVELVALDHGSLDISQSDAVCEAMRDVRPDLVINAAAFTAVDRAEDESDAAYATNRDGPEHLASSCAAHDTPLIHLSTDYVFDGLAKTPYTESDTPRPVGVYGRSKLEGEQAVRRRLSKHLILRLSWVFSSHGPNFARTIVRLAQEEEEIRVVADQHGCPTAAADVAGVVLELASHAGQDGFAGWGTYHYRGTPCSTWYGFAQIILDEARNHTPLAVRRIIATNTGDYPSRAARPANSVLDCHLIHEQFGIEPAEWKRALPDVVKAICHG